MRYTGLPGFLLLFASSAVAQDPFEIHIYEYEPMSLGGYSLEAHLNLTAQGTSLRDGALLPAARQTHLTLEPTAGFVAQLRSRHDVPDRVGTGPGLELRAGSAAETETPRVFAVVRILRRNRKHRRAALVPTRGASIFVGGDWKVRPELTVDMGIGFDLGEAGPGVIVKSRFEWHLGKRASPPRRL
jgi:hypothetical protein